MRLQYGTDTLEFRTRRTAEKGKWKKRRNSRHDLGVEIGASHGKAEVDQLAGYSVFRLRRLSAPDKGAIVSDRRGEIHEFVRATRGNNKR
jgi:hypothetical protein